VKDPAFLFYPGDFLIGTAELTNEEVGQYIRILSYMHQKGRLKEETIRLLVGSISVNLKSKFGIDDNGFWYNKRLENEIEKRKNFYKSRLENGRKGGRPKTTNNLIETESKPNHNLPININRNIIENKNEIELLVNEYYKYQKVSFPNLIKIDDKLINKSIETIDKLIRLDGFTLDDVKTVLSFVIKDDFWQKQVLSLVSLRNKGKNGNTKFVNAKISSESHISKSEKNKRVLEQWGRDREDK